MKIDFKKLNQFYKSDSLSDEIKNIVRTAVDLILFSDSPFVTKRNCYEMLGDLDLLKHEDDE